MTSVYDIPVDDVRKFLLSNNKNFDLETDGYQTALSLFKDKNVKGHTTSIIEWMIAHNLLVNNVDIPYYSSYEIDIMNQEEINKLAKRLTMKGNNRNNIKNILKYLNKLDEKELLLPELTNIIFNNLNQLDLRDIDVSKLKYDDVIDLLKTSRNKNIIRKFISDNLDKIIIYNDIGNRDLIYDSDYLLGYVTISNKDIILSILMDNYKLFQEFYTNDEIKNIIEGITESDQKMDIPGDSNILVDFTINLIMIDEIGLAKRTFDIANRLDYFNEPYPYSFNLLERVIKSRDINQLKVVISFMDEKEFINNTDEIPFNKSLLEWLIGTLIELKHYFLAEHIKNYMVYV